MVYSKKSAALCARKLIIEYTRTRKRLIAGPKRKLSSKATKTLIGEEMESLTLRQQKTIIKYLTKSFIDGTRDARNEIKGVKIIGGAAPTSKASIGFDLSTIKDSDLKRIVKTNIGSIGKYNATLEKELIQQYDILLSDNKLANSLKTSGWTPWMDTVLKKRGIDPAVISLVKQHTTTKKMLQVLNEQGIRGGLHPDQVAKRLIPHINRYFGPEGVTIDNVGKTVKRFTVDADGNYAWVDHKITRKYHATPRTYSRLVARSSMKDAHREAYYQSLQKTNLVDYYVSVSVMDARTCGDCAMMHGKIVTHADGPSYHGNCHCDLKPVWKRNSVLSDKNKSNSYYERQRDIHFMRSNDLKKFNTTMPSGSKLKNYALLPESALSRILPGPLHMRKIRHALMGEPAKIAPIVPPEIKPLTDAELQAEAKILYAKTERDGVEHMRLYTLDGSTRDFTGTQHGCAWVQPAGVFNSMHTHPTWDSPLSYDDLSSFLNIKNERQMSAASLERVYTVTKRKTTKALTKAQTADFVEEFKEEVKYVLKGFDESKLTNVDFRDAYLEAGQIMAKRYDVTYTVIDRIS